MSCQSIGINSAYQLTGEDTNGSIDREINLITNQISNLSLSNKSNSIEGKYAQDHLLQSDIKFIFNRTIENAQTGVFTEGNCLLPDNTLENGEIKQIKNDFLTKATAACEFKSNPKMLLKILKKVQELNVEDRESSGTPTNYNDLTIPNKKPEIKTVLAKNLVYNETLKSTTDIKNTVLKNLAVKPNESKSINKVKNTFSKKIAYKNNTKTDECSKEECKDIICNDITLLLNKLIFVHKNSEIKNSFASSEEKNFDIELFKNEYCSIEIKKIDKEILERVAKDSDQIYTYAKKNKITEMEEILGNLVHSGIAPTPKILRSFINVYRTLHKLERMEQLFTWMLKHDIYDEKACTMVLKTYVDNGKIDKALKTYYFLEEEKGFIDTDKEICYQLILDCLVNNDRMKDAKKIFNNHASINNKRTLEPVENPKRLNFDCHNATTGFVYLLIEPYLIKLAENKLEYSKISLVTGKGFNSKYRKEKNVAEFAMKTNCTALITKYHPTLRIIPYIPNDVLINSPNTGGIMIVRKKN